MGAASLTASQGTHLLKKTLTGIPVLVGASVAVAPAIAQLAINSAESNV